MRQILIILFSLLTFSASAQLYQRMPQYGYEMDRGRILLDLDIPTDTTNNKSGVVRIGATLYAGNGTYWTAAAAGTFDTAGIRIRPIPGTYMTISGTYPNLTFNVIYDSTILQTKFRSDTNRINVYNTFDTIVKNLSSPLGTLSITGSGDNIYADVVGSISGTPGNYIITYPTIERSNDTVDVIPNIIFQQGTLRDTITTGAQYIVPYASADQKRIDAIFVNPSGALDTLQGVEDSFFAVRPDLPSGSIIIADINVYGTDSIVVSNVGLFQKTAGVYVGDDAKLKTDSANYYYQEALRRLNAGSFRSTVVGGVALYVGNGSDIRSDERMYLTSASTMMFRVNGFGKRMAIYPSGNVGIGGADVDVPSALLNLFDSTSKGFLPPVMRGVRMNAISSPATGLIVYNSDSLSLCLYNGSAWVKLGTGGGSGSSGWGLTGNAGTNPTTDFIGTTDNVPFYVRVNNDTVARFLPQNSMSLYLGKANGAISFAGSTGEANGESSFSYSAGGNKANGYSSFAIGAGLGEANGDLSFASGNGTFANGINSASFGQDSRVYGNNSVVLGLLNVAKSKNALSIGRNSDTTGITNNDTSYLFRIGNGYISDDYVDIGTPSNILTVGYNGMVIGNHTSQLPDSTLHVVNGIKQANNYYTAAPSNTMLVWDSISGGYGHQAIPGGGSTTDSVQIGDDWFYTTKVTLTPAEVYTLNTVPVQAIAAPGSGKAIEIISASARMVFNTTEYSQCSVLSLVNNTTTQIIMSPLWNFCYSVNVGGSFLHSSNENTFTENASISITSNADETDGDSEVTVYIYYRIINL